MTERLFPEDFVWGVATSAQQIEGATTADGRSESIWDRYASIPGNIDDGSDPSVACDHYRRWREDLGLLSDLGVNAYRFSIAWPRVLPRGVGGVNAAGLDFYDALVDALLERNIQPFVTLYHWDLPQVLQDRGGWTSRDTAMAFADYAEVVATRLGDRVTHWITHNEPWCIATLGYEQGDHAPGHENPTEALRAAHHVLLSHGWAMERIRALSPRAKVGIVLNLTPSEAASDRPADYDAARWFDGFFNRWYLDPLLRGSYPRDAVEDRVAAGHLAAPLLPFVLSGDLQAMSLPRDRCVVNHCSRVAMRAPGAGGRGAVPQAPPEALTDMGWEVYPEGLAPLLVRLHREYGAPDLYITENGCAYADSPDSKGHIADSRRIAFMESHLGGAHRAIQAGVPLKGYSAWSLLDNFEWGQGYEKRFGLYWVDYPTQKRIPKDSAHAYRAIIAANGLAAGSPSGARSV